MIDYFSYLKNPIPYNSSEVSLSFKKNLTIFWKTTLLTFGLALIAAIFSYSFNEFLVYTFSIESLSKFQVNNFDHLIKSFGKYKLIFVALIVPALEELIFRLPLKIKSSFLAISIGMLLYPLFGFSYLHFDFASPKAYLFLSLFFIFLPILLNWLFTLINLEDILIKKYKYFFYFSASLFAIVHIPNFKPLNYNLIYLYPFYVLPQFVMGLSLGYLRNKCGLKYSWLLHGLINLPHGF